MNFQHGDIITLKLPKIDKSSGHVYYHPASIYQLFHFKAAVDGFTLQCLNPERCPYNICYPCMGMSIYSNKYLNYIGAKLVKRLKRQKSG